MSGSTLRLYPNIAVRAAKKVKVTVETPMATKKAHHGNVEPAKLLVIRPMTTDMTQSDPNHQAL